METGTFIRRNIIVLSSPTWGFMTVPLSHIVPLDTWQVLLLLHFPTCCAYWHLGDHQKCRVFINL